MSVISFTSHVLRAFGDDLRAIAAREMNFRAVRPVTSTLFLTYRCNSRCKTCTMWQRPHAEEKAKEIGFDQWKIVIDKLSEAGIRSTELFGGNVLLRKDLLIQILEYLHEKGIEVHLPTNQIGLDDEVAEAIVRHVCAAYISTDGIDDEQDSIRGIKGASGISEDSADRLVRLKRSMGPDGGALRLVCNCTVSKYNYHLLDKIVEYAVRKGFDEVHFEYVGEFDKNDIANSKIGDITPRPYYIKQDESILVSREQAVRLKESLLDLRKKHKGNKPAISTINIDSLSVRDLWQGTIPHDKCYVERLEVTVDPYGNMVICPFINNYILGDLVKSPFHDIWNNGKHRFFRKMQNSGRLPMCRHCILGVQRNPGLLKSLQRVYFSRIRPVLL